jgi:hypothetical protein
MRESVHDALEWLRHESAHPSRDWSAMCLSSARQAWGLPVLAHDARAWWARVPDRFRHHTLPKDVPAGAFCYANIGSWGHAWIAGHHGNGFTVDYRRRGFIDRAPMNLPAWTHDSKVWWTAHPAPGVNLPL